MCSKRSKQKGKRKEFEVETILYKYGFIREPDSGIITGCDLKRVVPGKAINYVEVKYRSGGFRTLYKFLEQSKTSDMLVIQASLKERLYVIPESKMLRLLEEAGYNDIKPEDPGYDLWVYRSEKRKSLKRR